MPFYTRLQWILGDPKSGSFCFFSHLNYRVTLQHVPSTFCFQLCKNKTFELQLWTFLRGGKKKRRPKNPNHLWWFATKALKASEEWKYKLRRERTSLYISARSKLNQLASPAAAQSFASDFYYSVGYSRNTRGWRGITVISQCHRQMYATATVSKAFS